VKIRLHLLFLFGSITLVGVSILIPTGRSLLSQEKLTDVRVGLPIPFLAQDLSRYNPPFFNELGERPNPPYKFTARLYSPWENPIRILWPQFILSVIIVYLIGHSIEKLIKCKKQTNQPTEKGKL